MIFENQHIAEEKIAQLTPEEAKLLNGRKGYLLGELYKLEEANAFDAEWPQSRFDFSSPQGKVKAYNEFIHYLITYNFARRENSTAVALMNLEDLSKDLGLLRDDFKDFLKDGMQVYVDSEDVLGKVIQESESEDAPKDTTASAEFKENFQEQLLNAVTQDSGNRAQMVLDYFDNNLGPLVDEFGMDGTELVFEILTILSEKEKERLGETSTPEVEEKITLDDLSFLDDGEEEEFRLVDLEEDADEFEI